MPDGQLLRPYRKIHTHPLIAETARGLAEAIWEEKCSKDNEFHARFGSAQGKVLFIGAWTPKLVPQARATLTEMLSGSYDSDLKDKISDALIKDHNLRHGLRDKPPRGLHR